MSPHDVIPYGRQSISQADIDAVVEVLRSDWLTQGPLVEEFEKELADFCGARYALAVTNGTTALTLACRAARLKPGDQGITSPLSFVASASCLVWCGATPRFADIDGDSWTIDPAQVEGLVTTATKVIIPVDFGGLPCDLLALREVADQAGAVLIVDACHSLGGRFRDRPVGGTGLAHMTCFSFHPVKAMTTGEGGAVVTDDSELALRLRQLRHHGVERGPLPADEGAWFYEVHHAGLNGRLTDLQCALGLSQLKRLPAFLARRQELVRYYREVLSDLPGLRLQQQPGDRVSGNHLFVVHLDPALYRRTAVFEAMRDGGIGCQVHYVPIHTHPFYREHFKSQPGDCPKAEAYYRGCLSLPLFPDLTDSQVERVASTFRQVLAAEEAARGSFAGSS
jgi:perosamine synthetase